MNMCMASSRINMMTMSLHNGYPFHTNSKFLLSHTKLQRSHKLYLPNNNNNNIRCNYNSTKGGRKDYTSNINKSKEEEEEEEEIYYRRRRRKLGSSCLVTPPTNGQKPVAVIQFIGGAFIGAIPHVSYSYLLELLAAEGYLIISVPYNVTFDHAQACTEIYERFNACVDTILTSELSIPNLSASEFIQLPFYSVGHSNGALLQALTGSVFSEKLPKANVIISYNNRPASEAVPYFEQLGPIVRQSMPVVEASPLYSIARGVSGDAWKAVLDLASMIPNYNAEAKESLTKFVDQLPSVMNQVTQGISEFKPTPSENRDCFKNSYNVKHTLLVKFNFDTIDETDLLEVSLKPRVESIGGILEKVLLTGTHITPCIQEPRWEVGDMYTPADAVAQSLKTLSLNDIRALARTITNWFSGLEQ